MGAAKNRLLDSDNCRGLYRPRGIPELASRVKVREFFSGFSGLLFALGIFFIWAGLAFLPNPAISLGGLAAVVLSFFVDRLTR